MMVPSVSMGWSKIPIMGLGNLCHLSQQALYCLPLPSVGPLILGPISPKPRLLWRIPRRTRELSVNKLATILGDIVNENSEASWNRLFLFPSHCLRSPARARHRRSLASQVNEAIRQESDQYHPSPTNNRLHHDPLKNFTTRVAVKLEEGDFKGAVRIASSVESFAPNNPVSH